MNCYQLIEQNLPTIIKLVKNNLVKVDMIEHIEIYENFQAMTGTKTERYAQLGKQFNLHPRTVQNIILRLNKKVQ
jgi:hypothetical protein